jgi:hypothetical protein
MRHIKPPVRFSDPVYIISACKKKLQPFEGQPRKWRQARRYPELAVQQSRIPYAGFGLFVAEDVKAGQPITTYKRKIISEREAKKLKDKVWIIYFRNSNNVENDVLTEQGNRHIRANHAACCCLDSKLTSSADLDSLRSTHDVAGFANSSEKPNAIFVDVGYDTVLEAKVDLVKGTEVLVKYSLV